MNAPNRFTKTIKKGLPRTGSIPRMQRGLPERRKIKDVKKVIAVSSAKGGVGKSTIAGLLPKILNRYFSKSRQ